MVKALMLYGIGLGSKPVAHAGFPIFFFFKGLGFGLALGLGLS